MTDQAAGNEGAAPSPPPAKRFDERVADTACSAIAGALAAHPELRAVSIVLDWDLPAATADTLSAGYFLSRDKQAHAAAGMIVQLGRMTSTLYAALRQLGAKGAA